MKKKDARALLLSDHRAFCFPPHMKSFVAQRIFLSFFLLSKKNKTRCTNRILQYFTKKILFSICFCARCQKGKGESVFHVASKVCVCFKLQPSQQTWVSGVSFPKQVPSPPSPLSFYTHMFSLFFSPPLASAPQGAVAVRTQAGKTGRPH